MATNTVAKPSGAPVTHKVHDVLRTEPQPLDALFAPRSVAVIGATEKAGTVGRAVLWNLITSPFGGSVFPVNPNRPHVLGIRSYPGIKDVPESVDMAVVITPAETVPGVIRDCAERGVRAAIVISAGFKETGPAGVELEQKVLYEARRGRMRIVGPNCFGVMAPPRGLNATFSHAIAHPGRIAFVSQSGALCAAVLDWSLREQVGFSAFASIGSMLDVGWGDLIYYLGDDPRTSAIMLYMESVGDARSFLSAAREVALTKPIIIIKAGRTEAAAQAAASHTGSLTGSDEVLHAAFRRSGVLRVDTIADLFHMAEVLAKQPRAKGNKLAIVTNAGGPGVLASDALMAGGGELAVLQPQTIEELSQFLSPHWSHSNPVDTIGGATAEVYARALRAVAKDPNADALLPILVAHGMADTTQAAEIIKGFAGELGKPILASWMGGADVEAGEHILNSANIPAYPYPETAARMFNYLWRYSYNIRGLYETPAATDIEGHDAERAMTLVAKARAAGRTLLTEHESKQVLEAYRIPTVRTMVAGSADEAVDLARLIGFPVVLKLHSETVTHKTDVGGVKLDLAGEPEVRAAFESIRRSVGEKAGAEHFLGVTVQPMEKREGYELILGSSLDPQFGPVLLFGAGGQLVEVFEDRALSLPPLNTTLARRMMEQTRIYKALGGVRGRAPVDLAALEQLLVRFSYLVVEQRWIKEIDINPLLASPGRLLALDARIVLHGSEIRQDELPALAIRPYPTQYAGPWTMHDGTPISIRPIRPEDEPLMVDFHKGLSERSVYLRYFNALKLSQRIAHERLTRICFIDYDREMALVAEHRRPDGTREIIGVARLSKLHGLNEAELAVLISDLYQHRGLGTELLRRVLQFGRDEKLDRAFSSFMEENVEMARISEKLGFKVRTSAEEHMLEAEIVLS
ncbi:MAG TPA: bifunctional acetate--CoA ligase family protein/GNAT family N-acetyltransferase [Terriglobales bacterium]|nr:bifunctional acetate--CoA ligase family protein/GNAT family N-acetyltransferase [Terriglobales bacterium]